MSFKIILFLKAKRPLSKNTVINWKVWHKSFSIDKKNAIVRSGYCVRFLTKTYFAMNIGTIIADSPDSVLMQRSLRVIFL
ncbi:hypothetical protein EI16_10200 [Hydrogenovibrio marinus]|uniref:Uncharacterized protein n=1 Tax=Hydrogenovibrio marinus TaxID=28885 RepID=A0A067A2N2_HYDMR|nr:hypothetical protein EI16_10200 [Hydrogenovibrio marinus]